MASRQPKNASTGPQRPRARSRRAGIVAAALEVVERDGVRGLTVRDVAAEVPISEPAVFYHFARKEDLLGAAALAVLREETDHLVATAEQSPEGVEAALAVFRARFEFYAERHALLELVHTHGMSRMSPEQREEGTAAVNRVFDALQARVFPGPPTQPGRRRLASLWLLSDGLLQLTYRVGAGLLTTRDRPERILEEVLALTRDALERLV